MTSEILTKVETALKVVSQRFLDMISVLSSSSEMALALGAVALMLAVVSGLVFAGSKPAATSRKAQQAKVMREAYKSMEIQGLVSDNMNVKVSPIIKSETFQQPGSHLPG